MNPNDIIIMVGNIFWGFIGFGIGGFTAFAMMGFGCKHDWVMVSEETTRSIVERAREQRYTANYIKPCDLEKKYINIFKCNKCGKIKKIVEKY